MNIFEKNKWEKIDLIKYREQKIFEKRDDNSIINPIFFEKLKTKTNNDLLKGLPFGIKDNFAIENSLTTSASKILNNFIPNYSATVYCKLLKSGAIPLFKTNLDELAMGGTGLTSNYGPVFNPFNNQYVAGGSSSGSNFIVADGTVPFSIGSDTGDSIRKPAAFTGIVGYKPTWGLVSRYGLFDFAPTWDTVGWFTNNVSESALLMDVLQGYDEKDSSSIHSTKKNYVKNIKLNNEKYNILVIPELENEIVDREILDDYKKVISTLKNDNQNIIEVKNINKSVLSTILLVYKVISSVEAFSCNSNLTGFQFGNYFKNKGKNYEEKIKLARTKGFNYEVKKRFLYAQHAKYSKQNYYLKAMKLRKLINDELNRILSLGDVLIIPTTTSLSSKTVSLKNFSNSGLLNNFLTLFNCNGSPSITIPVKKNKHLSTSVNVSSLPFNDDKVFKISKRLEELL